MKDYYKVLNVNKGADKKTIKKAYISLLKKYHPDIYTEDKEYAEQKTIEINEAYNALCGDNKDIINESVNNTNNTTKTNDAKTSNKTRTNYFNIKEWLKRVKKAFFTKEEKRKSVKTKNKKTNNVNKVKEKKNKKITEEKQEIKSEAKNKERINKHLVRTAIKNMLSSENGRLTFTIIILFVAILFIIALAVITT